LRPAPAINFSGLDNFIRPGSETNRAELKQLGVKLFHGDLRSASDLETLPPVDWVIDAAANPSVLAGVDGQTSSRQLVEHNLSGTINLLEFCKTHRAGFILLSTSRVYSIAPLAALPVEPHGDAFRLAATNPRPTGMGPAGIAEEFSTAAPVSLYGATKLASEALALEYGETFNLPVFLNRCGVLAGAGQFGRADQGIFAYWLNARLRHRPLKYIGFGGQGHQVRDCLHPRDLVPAPRETIRRSCAPAPSIVSPISPAAPLRQCPSANSPTWCDAQVRSRTPSQPKLRPRPFDHPVGRPRQLKSQPALVSGNRRLPRVAILEEIAAHAIAHPEWLDLSAPL